LSILIKNIMYLLRHN